MNNDFLKGHLVRLAPVDHEELASMIVKWSRDSEYWRLMASEASRPFSINQTRTWFEKEQPDNFNFLIRGLENNQAIGDIGLDGVRWNHGETFVGIGIGERAYLGKGYGTDAMQIILRYAFQELNLQRVALDVFEYNPRAIRSYEKVGFRHEGRVRECLQRAGRRWDLIYMGITREEWLSTLS
jgi:RimJ/RimL family protein N-acetyltransferase